MIFEDKVSVAYNLNKDDKNVGLAICTVSSGWELCTIVYNDDFSVLGIGAGCSTSSSGSGI